MKIKIHEFYLYTFLTLIAYGFYGAGTENFQNLLSSLPHLIHFLLPIIVFLLFLNKDFFRLSNNILVFSLPSFQAAKTKLLIIFLISIFLFVLSGNYMHLSITNDGLYYATNGIIHLLKISEIIVSGSDQFDEISIGLIIRLTGLAIVISTIILIFILFQIKNFSNVSKILIFGFILISLRVLISILGGATNPHPPLMGLPIFISTIFFGLNDFSLKLSYFLPFLALIYFIFSKLQEEATTLNALVLCIAIASMPGVLFLGSTVEQSLWSMICFSVVLIMLLKKSNIQYRNIFIIILLFCFMRSASIFAILPVIFHALFISKNKISLISKLRNLLKDASPLIFFLPFFIYTIIEGAEITVDRVAPTLGIIELFVSGAVFANLINSFGYFFSFVFLLLLLANLKDINGWMGLFFLLFLTVMYGLIDNSGHAKYQLEIYIPLFIFSILLFLKIYKNILGIALSVIGTVMIIINISTLVNFKSFCIVDKNAFDSISAKYNLEFGCNFVTHPPFRLDDAYKVIKEKNGFKNLYMPGVYYEGTLSPMMSKLTVGEWKSMKKLLFNQSRLERENGISWISGDAKLIHKNNNIQYVILAETQNYKKINGQLNNLGWKTIMMNTDKEFGTQVFVLSRN